IRYVAPPVYLLNAMLILAALPEGGHYLVDILAGFAVAAVSIRTVHLIAKLEILQQTGYEDAQSSEQQA
ncbi:phosphatase PAP2 family protein, partial [Mesorhizobium sp. P5_C1]